ncbi:MAG: HAD family phosphatase [Clostridia bacterium]|nr:HAD family phosphatase [Clostridia bacterium]
MKTVNRPIDFAGAEGFLFDMDGTLVDSMPSWRRLNIDFLEARGLPVPEETRADLMEMTNRSVIQEYLSRPGVTETFEDVWNEHKRRMQTYYRTSVVPKPHALQFLRRLAELGKPMCIATATPMDLARPVLERFGLLRGMAFAISSADEKLTKSKPQYYLEAAKRLHVAPENAVMFEDALYAMQGAKAAGLQVCGVMEPMQVRDAAEILRTCDVYIESFADLIQDFA